MRTSILSLVLALVFAAPATAATVSLTPLVVAQNTLPVLVNTCASPNIPAQVSGDAFFQMPSIAAAQGANGISIVKIQLNSSGTLLSHDIFASSGNPWLDQAALQSARMTRFTPETRNCEHVSGTYLFAVQY